MENNRDLMGWNAPGSNNSDNENKRPEQNNDPWGRTNNQRKSSDDIVAVALKFLKDLLGDKGNGGNRSSSSKKKSSLGLIPLIAVLAVGFYIFSGFYTVKEAEKGVVLRFGKIYNVVDSGLRWKFSGIDTVNVIDIEQVRAIQSSGTMLTEDENVVIVEMDVQYRISDPVKYLYSVVNPDNTLLEATDSALRYVVGHTLMDDILTSGREMVRQNTRELLTQIIEPYNTGLTIVDVNFLPARAPDQVKEAFDDAIAAQEDEQRYKREAEAYANEVLPKAEGQVQRIKQEAEGYRSQVVLKAEGEVARFEKVLPEYNAAPDITRTRIYLETMQEVLGKSNKIILDAPKGSNPVLYLPMPPQGPAPQLPVENKVESAPSTVNSSVNTQSSSQTSSNNYDKYPPLSNSRDNTYPTNARRVR
ncbi:MAG: FtsH protease activity modulator HflK [Succinatimonas sp.]|nr:FtsH protease activity modulator HflK [Succinatimonas sp.]MDD5869791.1 FtsH protease activity modulator HflK [Succinatimonas sp.]